MRSIFFCDETQDTTKYYYYSYYTIQELFKSRDLLFLLIKN
jgi:hypothetical protein